MKNKTKYNEQTLRDFFRLVSLDRPEVDVNTMTYQDMVELIENMDKDDVLTYICKLCDERQGGVPNGKN